MFRKSEQREFFAHHMLLHAAELEIEDAEANERGRFNKCLAAMVMTALAVEAIANAVGSRAVSDWAAFEPLRPHEKLDILVRELSIVRDETKEPWTTLAFLGGFRNDIAHAKPKIVATERVLPEAALAKTAFAAPRSKLEREITLGNARRVYAAVHAVKGILTDALPVEKRFGIYADMWSGSTSVA
jgi:hypothetical protein